MIYTIKISKKAKTDIQQAQQYYEEKRIGLGKEFIFEVKLKINILSDDTVEYKKVIDDNRRILLKRFPFVLYYERDNSKQQVIIIAVLHEKQDMYTNI